MHRSRSSWHLGMPHTISRALSEVALLMHAAHLQWNAIAHLLGQPASRLVDAEGHELYASVYFVEVSGFPDVGVATFGPDDHLEVVSALGRYGPSMLDGEHHLYAEGVLAAALPARLPSAPRVRLSNVLVALGEGPEDLRIATPANARIEHIPALPAEPDSYRLIKEAQLRGAFIDPPAGARRLWEGVQATVCAINPDRDLNGVGLLYFANYIAYMDVAERTALERGAGMAPEALDGRATVQRRVGFYGNAQPHDTLVLEVEAFATDDAPSRLLAHHRVRRQSDGRMIAVSSVEKRLRR